MIRFTFLTETLETTLADISALGPTVLLDSKVNESPVTEESQCEKAVGLHSVDESVAHH